ncbi:MAG: PDZ domain-containing protein, partial [Planctomycetota bacterium]|nr:PDZ domain-containing protein [Planctomycetota bacterium]
MSVLLLISAVICTPLAIRALEVDEPNAQDRQIVRTIAKRMKLFHLSNQDMDDDISKKGFQLYLKSLDPSKMYFYQSDIDEFGASADELDDLAKSGDLSFAFAVFNRFLKRIEERLVVINQLIESEHDFTLDEVMMTDSDELEFAKNPAELKDRWRKRIKYSMLVEKSEETANEDAKNKLHRRYTSFAKRMNQFDAEEVTELFLTSLTTAYDPHSTYFSQSTFDNFMIQMRLNLEGIGASLQSEDGVTVVKRIVPGGAADRNGKLKVEDRIVSVGQGDEGEMVDVADMKLDDVVAMIRGAAGTTVRLGVMPEGSNEIKTYPIVREKIELKDSEAQGQVFDAG